MTTTGITTPMVGSALYNERDPVRIARAACDVVRELALPKLHRENGIIFHCALFSVEFRRAGRLSDAEFSTVIRLASAAHNDAKPLRGKSAKQAEEAILKAADVETDHHRTIFDCIPVSREAVAQGTAMQAIAAAILSEHEATGRGYAARIVAAGIIRRSLECDS